MYISRRRMTKKLLLEFLSISSIFIFVFVFFSLSPRKVKHTSTLPKLHIHNHIQLANSACEGTLYPDLCVSTLSTVPDLHTKSLPMLIVATVNQTLDEVRASELNCSRIQKKFKHLDIREQRALQDCIELLDDTISDLKITISDLSKSSTSKYYNDLQTWFSAAMTNQYTCLDGFAYSNGKVRRMIKKRLYRISRHVSNSLAMLKKVKKKNSSSGRKLAEEYGVDVAEDGYPSWLSRKDRKLLQTSVNETVFDLIVAKDGSGNFSTIMEAVALAPNKSDTRFVIYIKAGAYFENVEVDKKKPNLMFVGDGIGKTVIKASRNVVDGWTTFRSATVAVVGTGFIAKGITIENAAGPAKHQAVALRSGSDLSAFFNCSFVGYQDTLYVHSLRQFYRDCDVYGTVDFIFGNAAVVLQKCNLYARLPMENQKNIYTAQGREDPNQNTGISILNCKVAAAADLIPNKTDFRTFLGRPWKEYSRTVFMYSYMEDVIDPVGWLEWNATFALETLYYGEYMNRGPGSNTSARVTWPGYRVINSSTEASKFTVGNFIQGSEWLNSTEIPYYSGLTP
ncbi:pectinesterase-like [Rutidosis leptorrhynchoides]|uniref:pectinesterase-like n=1 Tax=Rutidosis leptorrhynchoides TaxID=125765 RepID=UPI003A98E2BA